MLEEKFIKIKLPLIIYMFLLLFAPPIIKGINIVLILFVFSLFAILIKYREGLKEILHNKNIKKIILMVVLYYAWYCCTIVINALVSGNVYLYNYVINIYSIGLTIPVVTVCCMHIILYAKKHNISFNEIIKIMIISGLIQSGFTILCWLFPSFKRALLEFMYHNTGEELYLNRYFIERRFFGFANNLLDSFGFGTGVIAVLPLFYSIKNGKKWLLTVPFLLLVPLLNSRTGLVIFAIGFICWCIYMIKEKKFKEYSKIFAISVVFLILGILIVSWLLPTTMQWIYDDFLSFFTNKKGTADILFGGDFWKLPDPANIILGKGYNVAAFGQMKPIIGFASDVGYINEIWKTGIVGMGIQLCLLGIVTKYSLKNLSKEYKYFMIFLVLGILIANIKFSVFSYNPGIVIMTIIALMMGLKEEKANVEQEQISIIVPVYNVENYLKNCLDSIMNQTYKNLEIIIVNDGSTDGSGNICEEFSKKDKRIKYIVQENQGLSAARNNGMKQCTSNYYIFIDSDDYINIHFVEELYHTMMKTGADIAICGYQKVYENKKVNIEQKDQGMIEIYEGKDKFKNLYNHKGIITTVAWNKLYKKDIFSNIEYPNGKLHEDEFVIYDILNKAEKVAYTSCEYYYYLQRKGSITKNYNIKRLAALEALYDRLQKFKGKEDKKLYARTLYNYYYQLIHQWSMLKRYCSESQETIDKLYQEIIKYKREVLLNRYINPLRKLKIMLKLYIIK